jgi:hypothetical protein
MPIADIVIHANDGETAITDDGFLVGPDGWPLLGAGEHTDGFSDRDLSAAIEASFCDPYVPFFSGTSRPETASKQPRVVPARTARLESSTPMEADPQARPVAVVRERINGKHQRRRASLSVATESKDSIGAQCGAVAVNTPILAAMGLAPQGGISASARKK